MKLKVMNCKSCNAPLRLEGEKLVCDFCGASFDIEKDSNDIEYEKLANAEKYILQSLTSSKSKMEEFYQKKEEESIRKEKEDEERRKQLAKDVRKKTRRDLLKYGIFFLILIAGMILLIRFSDDRREKRKAEEKASQIEKNRDVPSYRVTDTQLKKDSKTLQKIHELALDYERKEVHCDELIEDFQVTWNMVSDPQILEEYLFTTEKGNGVYMLLKVTLESDDGRTRDVYDCVVVSDITVNREGKLSIPKDVYVNSEKASDYDYFWDGSPDETLIKSEIIEGKKADPNAVMQYFFTL